MRLLSLTIAVIIAGASLEVSGVPLYPSLELQGHRGARGLAPENTVPAFHLAYLHGMTTIELDSTLTADGALIIHHDTQVNTTLCRRPDGAVPRAQRILDLKVSEVQALDCGSIAHQRFLNSSSKRHILHA